MSISFFCKTLYDDWYEINLNISHGVHSYEIQQVTAIPKDITTNYYRNITKSLHNNHKRIYTALDNLTENKLEEVYTRIRNPYEEAPIKIQKRSLPSSSSGDGRRRKPKKSKKKRLQQKKSKKNIFSTQKNV